MFQATNIIPEEQIFASLTEIQAFLEAHYTSDNPEACIDRGNQIESYLALSSKLVADSKYWLDQAMNGAITDTVKQALSDGGWSAMAINKKVEALCKEFNYLVTWSGRINSCCVHQLDFLRSIISKQKEELRQLKYGGQT